MTRTGHAFFTEGGGSFTDGGPVKMLGITTSGEEPSTPHQIVEHADRSADSKKFRQTYLSEY